MSSPAAFRLATSPWLRGVVRACLKGRTRLSIYIPRRVGGTSRKGGASPKSPGVSAAIKYKTSSTHVSLCLHSFSLLHLVSSHFPPWMLLSLKSPASPTSSASPSLPPLLEKSSSRSVFAFALPPPHAHPLFQDPRCSSQPDWYASTPFSQFPLLTRVRSQLSDWKHRDFVAPPGAVLGCDFAGVVQKVTEGVTNVKVGDRVASFVHGGAYDDHGAFAGEPRLPSFP